MGYVDIRDRVKREDPQVIEVFWHDVRHNPYFSIAAGLVIGIPVVWTSIWWPLEPWGLSLIPSTFLVGRGIWQLRRRRPLSARPKTGGEKQLLMAIRDSGGLTVVEAALETSLTVDEADELLTRLADRGYLFVQGRDGALFYSLPGGRLEGPFAPGT